MSSKQDEDENHDTQILLTLLHESYQHWRHIENLRQGFTAVWAAVVAGVLAFITQTENFLTSLASLPALVFLFILTLLGLLMSIRLGYNIKPCEDNISDILRHLKKKEYDPTSKLGRGNYQTL